MPDDPVKLDQHRGMLAQQQTENRRLLQGVKADQDDVRVRQEEFEALLLVADAHTWPEAAAKARYLIQLYAGTPDAQDQRRQQLIANTLADFDRLSE